MSVCSSWVLQLLDFEMLLLGYRSCAGPEGKSASKSKGCIQMTVSYSLKIHRLTWGYSKDCYEDTRRPGSV